MKEFNVQIPIWITVSAETAEEAKKLATDRLNEETQNKYKLTPEDVEDCYE